MSADDERLFALLHTGQLVMMHAETLEKKGEKKCSYDATHMVFSKANDQLWIGDKAGKVHVHKADGSFEEVFTFEKHTKNITAMAVSADGTKVATGDNYRYIYVHDAATHTETGKYA